MTRTLPASCYSDSEVFELERRSVWSSEWIMFAPRAALDRPGAYVVDEVAGFPLMVVVDPDGGLRGYHNVCPHRAGVLLWPGQGTAGNLVCRYHGWAFGWDGCLKNARDFGCDPDAGENSLRAVRVETWGPLVFVNLDPDARPLVDSLGSLDAAVRAHDFEGFTYGQIGRAHV